MANLPNYTYLVSDLLTNTTLAEIPLAGVRYSKRLNDTGQLSGTVHLGDPRVRLIDPHDLTTPTRRVIYALRDDTPIWGGLIWTRRYDSVSEVISIGCGDFWSYFDHRKVLPPLDPVSYDDPHYVAGLSVSWRPIEQNEIVRQLIAGAQSEPAGNIGVTVVGANTGTARERTYYGYQNMDLGEVLRKLAGQQDGPDMIFDVGPLDERGRPTRLLRLGDPRLGQQGSAHVWEYGANLVSYEWPSDGTRMATRTFAAGDGIETGMLIAVAEDIGRYAYNWPLLESEHGYTSVTDWGELRGHAISDQWSSRLPVVVPTLRVRGDLPPTMAEVGVGDDARVIIKDALHPRGIDVGMRIVGLDVSVTDSGDEHVTLTMNPLIEELS
jgi:hypothetical protein